MNCENPYISNGGQAFGCGQCLPCRLNRRRVWTHRIMLEAAQYTDNCFVTLTYDDEHLPAGNTLVPKDMQDFLKRFRKAIEPQRIRYYGVGEYGDESQRPHYHLAIFGYPSCRFGITRRFAGRRASGCCAACDQVSGSWGAGHVMLGSLSVESSQYIAGYVTKKMTSGSDPRLLGRYPEFARMSLRPGIGFSAMDEVGRVLRELGLAEGLSDVPAALRHGTRLLPLGRYLRRRLRRLIGRDEKVPQAAMDELAAEMFDLRMAARSSTENPSLKYHVKEANRGRVAGIRARASIQKKRGSL